MADDQDVTESAAPPQPELRPPDGRFDRFTQRARKVLMLAQAEAHSLDHNYIGTEHLLLGLLMEEEGLAARVLTELGVQPDQVRSSVLSTIGRGDPAAVAGAIGLTPRAKRALEEAVAEARSMGQHYVGTEHELLGLLREGSGIAAGVLHSFGVGLDAARRKVVDACEAGPANARVSASYIEPLTELEAVAGQRPEAVKAGDEAEVNRQRAREVQLRARLTGGPTIAGRRDNVIACRVDDELLEVIDALVEAGVRSTRSDAAAWLIKAGADAQKELMKKARATASEIRQLRASMQAVSG